MNLVRHYPMPDAQGSCHLDCEANLQGLSCDACAGQCDVGKPCPREPVPSDFEDSQRAALFDGAEQEQKRVDRLVNWGAAFGVVAIMLWAVFA